jgi:hypothetical protein
MAGEANPTVAAAIAAAADRATVSFFIVSSSFQELRGADEIIGLPQLPTNWSNPPHVG